MRETKADRQSRLLWALLKVQGPLRIQRDVLENYDPQTDVLITHEDPLTNELILSTASLQITGETPE